MELDLVVMALTLWRENRGGGEAGMHSVANVIMNRARKSGRSVYHECVAPWQFSSMTAKGDPQTWLWPAESDPSWATALGITRHAIAGTLEDITGGATFYYATSMKIPPMWADGKTPTATIAGQVFFA